MLVLTFLQAWASNVHGLRFKRRLTKAIRSQHQIKLYLFHEAIN